MFYKKIYENSYALTNVFNNKYPILRIREKNVSIK